MITAVVFEKRPVREVVAEYGVSRSWVYELVARYRTEGGVAFEARSKRPNNSPTKLANETISLIVEVRDDLARRGLDAGPATICWHLQHHHDVTVSPATVHRYVKAAGRVTPEPKKKPKSAYIRFEADQPNECWQSDYTHYPLRDGTDVEIITWLDDHSRFALSITGHQPVKGTTVIDTFTRSVETFGCPFSTLTDNGLVYTTRFSGGGNGGRNGFENVLVRLGVIQKNSRPSHPTTCGKVERFQQTLKNWLRAQPDQPGDLQHLDKLLEQFRNEYNQHRPHRSLANRTPAAAYNSRPKAGPAGRDDPHWRVRHDRIDAGGKITLRHQGHLFKIGIGRPHARTRVIALIKDLDIRIVHATTGEILRTLTLDTTRTYQPTGRPEGGPKGPRKRTNPNP